MRRLLDIARQNPHLALALAPEGQDLPDGRLMQPPPGVGRLLARLDGLGYPYLPVGVAENERSLMLTFGPPFRLN